MEKKAVKILYLDDEGANLEVFKALFRKDYEIYLVTSPADAMAILEEKELNVIIADQKMPEMSGVEFFERILKKYPQPIRILMTGYTDIGSVIDAINKGQVYRYITKPWNEQELKLAIENAFEIYDVRRKLETTNLELKKRNDELNRFVYSASHEMKAPLMTISGILKMASENNQIDASQYFLMIEKCTKNLQVFIKNIVDYYRNQRYEQQLKEVSFEFLLRELIEGYMFYESASDVNFSISVNEKEKFAGDEFRLKVILSNVISNSIKYQKKENHNKKVIISITTTRDNAEILVEDNGIGIPQKYLNRIFNMFFRATEFGQGSGIGLYIVKEAVEKINGMIDVSSEEGNGTRFKIIIPNRLNELKQVQL
jgi:signal transduction histidine kinase